MSAIPEDFIKKTAELSEEVTRPFPNSTKVYVQGSRPDIRVPMREISQSPTSASFGEEENPPVTVYDTSGPFTDPDVKIDLLKGGAKLEVVPERLRGETALFDIVDKKGDVIVRLSTDDGRYQRDGFVGKDTEEEPQLRGCLRGRSYRQRLYSAERLLYPMGRVGKRGEGKFKRISWDEALDRTAERLRQVRARWGDAAVLLATGAGSMSGRGFSGATAAVRFFQAPGAGLDG